MLYFSLLAQNECQLGIQVSTTTQNVANLQFQEEAIRVQEHLQMCALLQCGAAALSHYRCKTTAKPSLYWSP